MDYIMIPCRLCQSERSEVKLSSRAREASAFCSGVCSEGHSAAPEQSNTIVFGFFMCVHCCCRSDLRSFKEQGSASQHYLITGPSVPVCSAHSLLFSCFTQSHTHTVMHSLCLGFACFYWWCMKAATLM